MKDKAMSPGRLVLRRFLRSKLAVAGVVILTAMFLFSFLGPYLYRYGQTEVFQTYGIMNAELAGAKERTEYELFEWQPTKLSVPAQTQLEAGVWVDGDRLMAAEQLAEGLYAIGEGHLEQTTLVGTYNSKLGLFPGRTEGLASAVSAALKSKKDLFFYENTLYFLKKTDLSVETAVYTGTVRLSGAPEAMASLWHVEGVPEEQQAQLLYQNGTAGATKLVVRDASGRDTLSPEFKKKVEETIENMGQTGTFFYPMPALDDSGDLVDTEVTVTRKPLEYAITCTQRVYMLDRYAPPSKAHPLGTDGDGMDVLARMMAGGRISLLVGFVVVLLEVLLGVILGGLAGYFGRWTDSVIMRLVDVFYCIPSMPILIILGAMFDSIRMAPYARLFWLMAVLGFLGWASIARMVRGQILSLREQEFMVAAEAAGLPASRKIFRHLIPNVMPQLIVTATMGLGSVILTESTLSFLGLGVKHPMATWGTMINSVAKSAETMMRYTHIWLPVGLLICLTVIAFNFVGDGLRDALDPKMKR